MSNTTTKLALALSLLLPTIACDLDALPSSDRAALTTDDDADGARPAARRPGPPPPLMLLERAVEVGGLQDDADMAEALAAMETAHDDAVAAGDDLRVALADAVAADTVTADGFATQLAALGQTAAAEGDALTVALDTAHGLLDAELRAEVVDGLPEPPAPPQDGQQPQGGPPPSGDRPSGEPPSDEQQAPQDGQEPPPPGAGPDDGGPRMLLEALDLDEDQQAALHDALGEPERPEPPAPLDLEAFADDDFAAESLGLSALHSDHVTEHATRQLELLVALVPLLDDDQRATLEDLLREAPPEPTRNARG